MPVGAPLNAGQGFQGHGFTDDSGFGLRMAADPSFVGMPPQEALYSAEAAPLSRLDMNPVSYDPFTEEDNYQPGYVLDAMQQEAGPAPGMLDRPYREVDNLPEWGPSEMAQFQEKERIARELGISPEVINQWNIPVSYTHLRAHET